MNHINLNRQDNSSDILALVTPSENMKHAHTVESVLSGHPRGMAK